MMSKTIMITAEDIEELGFSKRVSAEVLKEAKIDLVNQGYPIYDNKMIKQVPAYAVESILGFVFPYPAEPNEEVERQYHNQS